MDLQDKKKWCDSGAEKEVYFLDSIAPLYGLDLVKHPKKGNDVYATDFQLRNVHFDADLKCVETPFFKSETYGYNPDYTVTFNHKDYIRYRYKYPEWGDDMAVIFWVEWEGQERFGTFVNACSGVWSMRIGEFDSWVRSGKMTCHEYLQRKEFSGTNAKYSWLVDLRKCKKHFKIV